MNYNEVEKIIVAPQIVIYRNIFKNSKQLIDLLRVDSDESLFDKWRDWYEQGYRKGIVFDRLNTDLAKTEVSSLEVKYMLEVANIFDFIVKDYFEMYGGDKGIWPDYITDWDIFKQQRNSFYIDYFRYSLDCKVDSKNDELLMFYHVDEFRIPGQFKKKRNVATLNFYLNEEYTGGQICVYDSVSDKSYQYKPKEGDVVIMPSTSPFYHAVKAYDKADRYFLRTFIEYPVHETDENNYNWEELKKQEDEFIKNNMQWIKISAAENIVE